MELAWVAGFIDGEGCFSASASRTPNLRITQKTDYPLIRIQSILNAGKIYKRKTNIPAYEYYLGGQKLLAPLTVIEPLLFLKKKEASAIIEFLSHRKRGEIFDYNFIRI